MYNEAQTIKQYFSIKQINNKKYTYISVLTFKTFADNVFRCISYIFLDLPIHDSRGFKVKEPKW